MSKKQVEIVKILKAVGVYQQTRKLVSSDTELAELFDQDFEQLVEQVQK